MSESRFFMDHGVIHDRLTGKHVVTDGEPPFEDGVEHVCDLLNGLSAPAQTRPDYGKMSVDMAIEACAKVADDFAAYEQTVLDRAHADDVLSETGRKSIVVAAGSRQVAAEQIAHDIRALSLPSTDRGGAT